MATPVMSVAHDARVIAQELISEHHLHLAQAEILYVFTDQRRKRCDRVRLGSAAKMNSLQRFLASGQDSVEDGPDFIILIDSNLYADPTRSQRKALIDHELCHCAVFVKEGRGPAAAWRRLKLDESPSDFPEWRFGMRGHDIEEFAEVLQRHGFWKPDGPERLIGQIVLQLKIPERNSSKAAD